MLYLCLYCNLRCLLFEVYFIVCGCKAKNNYLGSSMGSSFSQVTLPGKEAWQTSSASGNVNSISKVAFIVPPLSVTTIFVITVGKNEK